MTGTFRAEARFPKHRRNRWRRQNAVENDASIKRLDRVEAEEWVASLAA